MNTRNKEGYCDPTASLAIENISIEEQQVYKIIHLIKDIVALGGFEIVGRVEFRHRDSGRIYK